MEDYVKIDGIIMQENHTGDFPILRFYQEMQKIEIGQMIIDMIAVSQELSRAYSFKHVPALSANPYYDGMILEQVTKILKDYGMLHLLEQPTEYVKGTVINDKFYEITCDFTK